MAGHQYDPSLFYGTTRKLVQIIVAGILQPPLEGCSGTAYQLPYLKLSSCMQASLAYVVSHCICVRSSARLIGIFIQAAEAVRLVQTSSLITLPKLWQVLLNLGTGIV